jgi:hypothetical protein
MHAFTLRINRRDEKRMWGKGGKKVKLQKYMKSLLTEFSEALFH